MLNKLKWPSLWYNDIQHSHCLTDTETSLLTVAEVSVAMATVGSSDDSSIICRHCRHLLVRLLKMVSLRCTVAISLYGCLRW